VKRVAYYLVQNAKKKSELHVVRKKCLLAEYDPALPEQQVFIGDLDDSVPPAEVTSVKGKNSPYKGPGIYWRRILSTHGK
jgi:hypothetical protein